MSNKITDNRNKKITIKPNAPYTATASPGEKCTVVLFSGAKIKVVFAPTSAGEETLAPYPHDKDAVGKTAVTSVTVTVTEGSSAVFYMT